MPEETLEERANGDGSSSESVLGDAESSSLNYKALQNLHDKFEKAQELRQEYNDLLNTNPTALKAAIKAHSKRVGFDTNLKELEEKYPELWDDNIRSYQLVAQIGNLIVSHEFGREEADYQAAFRDKSGALLDGAPDNIYRILVKNADKRKIEKLVDEYGDIAKDHKEYHNQLDLLQKWTQQGKEGAEARKTLREKFKEENKALYNGFENLVEQIVDALSLDYRHYLEKAKKMGEDLANKARNNRPYLAEVSGRNTLNEYITAELRGRLPSEVPMGLTQAA